MVSILSHRATQVMDGVMGAVMNRHGLATSRSFCPSPRFYLAAAYFWVALRRLTASAMRVRSSGVRLRFFFRFRTFGESGCTFAGRPPLVGDLVTAEPMAAKEALRRYLIS